MAGREIEPVLLHDWHVIADASRGLRAPMRTTLFDETLEVSGERPGEARVRRVADGRELPAVERYGFVWTCLGEPQRDVLDIPETREPDRHVLGGGSFRVQVSGLRAVENFLDMGHFPFVHTGYLGIEPHTEVAPYTVSVEVDGVEASDCRFFQPVASPSATGGLMVDYVYRVLRPYTVALYKTNPGYSDRLDFIALFIQPTGEEQCIVHTFLAYLEKDIDAATVRWFMQIIFAQDRPILENQRPRRLPLDPRAETPVRADAASIGYRRWLRERGVRYGAIPAAA